MNIKIIAHPKSSRNKILQKNEFYHVYITSPPEKNKANKKIIELLADYFQKPKSKIIIKSGEHSRNKMFELID